jgi:hypothetical protein
MNMNVDGAALRTKDVRKDNETATNQKEADDESENFTFR